jgi:hypothetical protein
MVRGAVSGAARSGRGGALHASAHLGAHSPLQVRGSGAAPGMQVLISAPAPHSRYVAAARARVALGEAAAAEDLLLSVLSSRQRAECTVQAEYAA